MQNASHVDIVKALDTVVSRCPTYRWRKKGIVYVVEPRKKSDSILNSQVAGIQKTLTCTELLGILSQEAGLDAPDPFAGMVGFPKGSWIPSQGHRVPFNLPSSTMKDAVIEAAIQSAPSAWLVSYSSNNGVEYLDYRGDRAETFE